MNKKAPDSTDAYVGERLKARRTILGHTQQTMAKTLGVTFQQVQKYEKGTNRIGAGRLHHAAHILKVPVAYFFEGLPPAPDLAEWGPSTASVSEFVRSVEGLAFIRAYMRLPDAATKRKVLELVEQMVD